MELNAQQNERNEVLDIDVLESRLEMESVAALAQPSGAAIAPITICHWG